MSLTYGCLASLIINDDVDGPVEPPRRPDDETPKSCEGCSLLGRCPIAARAGFWAVDCPRRLQRDAARALATLSDRRRGLQRLLGRPRG